MADPNTTTIVVAAITGSAAVLAGGVGGWVAAVAKGRVEVRAASGARKEAEYAERRDAYADFFILARTIDGRSQGARASHNLVQPDADMSREWERSSGLLRLICPPETWIILDRYAQGISARHNSVSPVSNAARDQAAAHVRTLGMDTEDGFRRVETDAMAAARLDLANVRE